MVKLKLKMPSDIGDILTREELKRVFGGVGSKGSKTLPNCPPLFGSNCTKQDADNKTSCWYYVYEGGGKKAIGKCSPMPTGTAVAYLCTNWGKAREECK